MLYYNLNIMRYGLDFTLDNSWMRVNNDIIEPSDLRFMLSWVKWNFDWLPEYDIPLAKNVNRWFKSKQEKVYSLDNPLISNDRVVQRLHGSWEMNTNQKLLSDLMEYAVLDFLQAKFKEKWIKVLKTSEYDDIKSWVDYILIGKDWQKLWVDLTFSTNEEILSKKRSLESILPIEFLAAVEEKEYDERDWKLLLKDARDSRMKKFVLNMEPQFMQFFVSGYIDQVASYDDPDEILEDVALDSWNFAMESYQETDFQDESSWIYRWLSKEQVLQDIEKTNKSLIEILDGKSKTY